MPSKEALERLGTTQLAVLCQKLADEPDIDRRTAEEALQLKQEWALLQTPPSPTLKEEKEKGQSMEALRMRMIKFLSQVG